MPTPPHGGPRPGAGRPPSGKPRKVKTSVAIDPDLLEALETEAALRGVSRNALIEEGARLVLQGAALGRPGGEPQAQNTEGSDG